MMPIWKNNMIVMKFGGSSLANAECINNAAGIVKANLSKKPLVVLSAMGDTTDILLDNAKNACENGSFSMSEIKEIHFSAVKKLGIENYSGDMQMLFDELEKLFSGIALLRELTKRTKDYLVSFGERFSVRIFAAFLKKSGLNAKAFDSWEIGFVSNSNYGSAELLPETYQTTHEKIEPLLAEGILPVVTGYIAKDAEGSITTLGRGGSDLSAAVIASACGAEEVQFWKDVDGILSSDPRIVKNAMPVENITYEAAAELAYFGAQVLHPRAMQPCLKTGTPILVKNSFNIESNGTRITGSVQKKQRPILALSLRRNVTLVDIVSSRMLGQYGFLAEVFACFARNLISVDMVATSEVSVSLTLDAVEDLSAVKTELERIAAVEIKTGKAILSIIGDVRRSSEILSRSFRTCELLGTQVQMISQGASKLNISFIIDDTEAAETVRALHEDFFGNIGGAE